MNDLIEAMAAAAVEMYRRDTRGTADARKALLDACDALRDMAAA